MSPTRRIVINIAATYGRSLYSLACGIITARWVYVTLGESDYGLMGVVGGITAFISFINNVLSLSVGRYYAFYVGKASKDAATGLLECRQWFNSAFVIHSVIPTVLMAIGYPIGIWAVRHFLTIPPDRVESFVWIFRFSCITRFWGMISVPFNAMYVAKQYIAELTIYSFVTTTLNVFFLWYMVSHPGDWVVRLGLWNCMMVMVPAVIITLRAYVIFPECRFVPKYMKSIRHLREMLGYAGWFSIELFGNLFRFNSLPILVNKYFGAAQNAALSIADTVAAHAQSLSGALRTAFQPAIVNALGAREMDKAISLMHRVCKFGTLLVLVFCIPLSVEIKEVLNIWLKTPPEGSAMLSIGILASLILEKLTTGHFIMINGQGRIARYQISVGICFTMTFFLAWVLMAVGVGVYSVAYSINATLAVACLIRLYFVKKTFNVGPRIWLYKIFIPIAIATAIPAAIGFIPRLFMPASFLRVVVTTAVVETFFLPMSWFFVLDGGERIYFIKKLQGYVGKLVR